MGLWNFIKEAGKSLGFGGEAQAAEPADAIRKELDGLGLDASNLDIQVDGDRVTIKGDVPDQETREKIIIAAGNVEGIAEVEEQVTAPNAKEPVFHEVQKGDTLWAIAEKHLGNGAKYPEIFEANRPMLSDPDKIYPGQKLRIPG